MAGGLLTGAAASAAGRRTEGSALLAHPAREQRIAANLERLQEYEALAGQLGVTPTALGRAWLLAQPGVTAPVIGPRTVGQLTGSLAALDMTIEAETAEALDTLFPGPGGEVPDAYTWS